VPLRVWTRVVPGNHVLVEAPIPRGWGIFGSISLHIVKYREYSACYRYYQPYSVGGSSDAAFRRQYYSNLLHQTVKLKVKFSHTRYRALGPELIPVYRQSARR